MCFVSKYFLKERDFFDWLPRKSFVNLNQCSKRIRTTAPYCGYIFLKENGTILLKKKEKEKKRKDHLESALKSRSFLIEAGENSKASFCAAFFWRRKFKSLERKFRFIPSPRNSWFLSNAHITAGPLVGARAHAHLSDIRQKRLEGRRAESLLLYPQRR